MKKEYSIKVQYTTWKVKLFFLLHAIPTALLRKFLGTHASSVLSPWRRSTREACVPRLHRFWASSRRHVELLRKFLGTHASSVLSPWRRSTREACVPRLHRFWASHLRHEQLLRKSQVFIVRGAPRPWAIPLSFAAQPDRRECLSKLAQHANQLAEDFLFRSRRFNAPRDRL
jgi:hypothetical protein